MLNLRIYLDSLNCQQMNIENCYSILILHFFQNKTFINSCIPILQIKTFNLSRVHLQATFNAYIINMVYEMGLK